jgi:hypothetical protein
VFVLAGAIFLSLLFEFVELKEKAEFLVRKSSKLQRYTELLKIGSGAKTLALLIRVLSKGRRQLLLKGPILPKQPEENAGETHYVGLVFGLEKLLRF